MSVAVATVADMDAQAGVMMRAWRVCLDPNVEQRAAFARNAGTARFAFNYALARKIAHHKVFLVAKAAALGEVAEPTPAQVKAAAVAARTASGPIPNSVANLSAWRLECGDDRIGLPGISPWFHTVSSYTWRSAMRDADAAFWAWFDSLADRRAGRAVGYPRFKCAA